MTLSASITETPAATGLDDTRLSLLDFIEGQLASGDLLVGQRLPSERELAEKLRCSRYELRRQMAVLEDEGRVTRGVGRGTFLQPPSPSRATNPQASSPHAIIEARTAWEPALMPLVAVRASSEDFARIRDRLVEGDHAHAAKDREEADIAFHHSLVAATHNDVVLRIHRHLESSRRSLAWGRVGQDIYTPENWKSCQHEHALIVAALEERDAPAARRSMRAHLISVRRQFFGEI